MTTLGLWAIIFSAVILAYIIGAAVSTLVVSTKWYRKWVAKLSWSYTEEVLGQMDKTDENVNNDTDEITDEDTEVIKLDWISK